MADGDELVDDERGPAADAGERIAEIYRQRTELQQKQRRERLERSVEELGKRLREDGSDAATYIDLAARHKSLNEHAEGLAVLERGLRECAPSAELYRQYCRMSAKCNRTRDAIAAAQEGLRHFPQDMLLKLNEALQLPMLYDTRAEVDSYRGRYEEGLRRIVRETNLETEEQRRQALEGIGRHVNFRLAYQGRNDRELQTIYGDFVHRIMAANYPEWARPLGMPPVEGKIRVGYVSAFFRYHSVTKLNSGWMLRHDKRRFEVYAYHVGEETDSVTDEIRKAVTGFHQGTRDLEGTCQAIRSDRLHVAIFLDIGMDPIMTQMAGLHLAPIQCTTWGHPVTSGLPTVRYFLSSAAMEPDGAQQHYSEELIRLPNIGICCRKPVIPHALLRKTREQFGMRTDAVAYLSCQSILKYLPEHDDVFPLIAARVPKAQFVFLTGKALVASDFIRRLERAFAAHGLDARDFCVMQPEQNFLDYWNLNSVCDVFLDTIGWSGANTTLEALANGLPVLTMPGDVMRARHTQAFLQQVGIPEMVVSGKQEYVETATQLGRDIEMRKAIAQRIEKGYSRIYTDESATALEEFCRRKAVDRTADIS